MPEIADRMFLFRPTLADPPLCTLAELKTALDLSDLCDLHDQLDLKEELMRRAEADAK